MSELPRPCAAASPAQAEDELEQGRGSSLEEEDGDAQDELAPLPPPGGPRQGELADMAQNPTDP